MLCILCFEIITGLNTNQNYVRKTLLDNDGKTPSIIAYDYTNLEVQLENENVINNGRFKYFKSPMDEISTEYIANRDGTSSARNFDVDWLEIKDSIQNTKAKEVSRAISDFTLILACITSAAFMLFPGSLTDPKSTISATTTITTTTSSTTIGMSNHETNLYQQYSQYEEERDFSYSEGVVWEDLDDSQLNPFTKRFVDLSE